MPVGEHLPAHGSRLRIEASMRAVVSRNGLKQIGRRFGRQRLARQLAAIADLREIAVEQAGRDPICQDRFDG